MRARYNLAATMLLITGAVDSWSTFGTLLRLSRALRVLRLASVTATIQQFFRILFPVFKLIVRFSVLYWLLTCAINSNSLRCVFP